MYERYGISLASRLDFYWATRKRQDAHGQGVDQLPRDEVILGQAKSLRAQMTTQQNDKEKKKKKKEK
jgi:hypothetical protein